MVLLEHSLSCQVLLVVHLLLLQRHRRALLDNPQHHLVVLIANGLILGFPSIAQVT